MAGRQKPDFSGEWILNRGASTLSTGADAVRSGVWTIDHREPAFRHKATFVTDAKPFTFEYELVSDGPEVRGADHGSPTVGTLRWDGDALVVTWRTLGPAGDERISFRCEVAGDGRRLRAAEQVRGTDHDQDNVWVFDRG